MFKVILLYLLACNVQAKLPPGAHPVQLLNMNGVDGELQFDQNTVNDLFMNPKLVHRNVVVFSIVGAFRKGKSFLLNYVLRYLYSNYESVSNSNLINSDDWLGDENEPLTGFSWKSGTDRDTTGLILWSDVFLYDAPNGEKLAIYIMDTQGLFDHQTTTADNSRIFSLSTLISSVQILNLFNIIHEDQLQYLQFATEFARYASESKTNSKSFQKLLILIRDWNNPAVFNFGFRGGNQYLKNFLTIKDDQKPELKSVRRYLGSAFESINCFLMPYPGRTVARVSTYDGNWADIDEEFVESMKELFPTLLGPKKLNAKIINGNVVKPAELLVFIKTYVEQFKSGEIPAAQSIYESTLDKQFQILMAKSVDIYIDFIKAKQTELNDLNDINNLHKEAYSNALSFFGAEKKFGTYSEGAEFKTQLKTKLENIFEQWKAVAIVHIQKLTDERINTQNQLQQRDLAQTKNNLANTELDEAVRKVGDANYELNKAKQETEAARKQSEVLMVKLEQAEEARAIAIAKEKEATHGSAIEHRKAKAELEDAMRLIEITKNELKTTIANSEQAVRDAEMLRLKSIEAETARANAVVKQQETMILLEEMKQKAAMYERQYNENKAAANNNVGETLQGEQKDNGFAGVLLKITGIVSAVSNVVTFIGGLFG